jgi:FlaA1/EpsC-like NDP-sugar epimerase
LVPGKDIEIEFCGIRPGEKLYEEILTSEEGTNATRHERIFVSKPNDLNPERFWEDLAYLEKWVSVTDQVKVVEKLCQMIPRYTPSEYWRAQLVTTAQEEAGATIEAWAVQDNGRL